jgi:hypothetical protein
MDAMDICIVAILTYKDFIKMERRYIMCDKVCPFCQNIILPYDDTIIGHDNQLYHYDCYMEYEDDMKDNSQINKEIPCT